MQENAKELTVLPDSLAGLREPYYFLVLRKGKPSSKGGGRGQGGQRYKGEEEMKESQPFNV